MPENTQLRLKYIKDVKNFQLIVGLMNDDSSKVSVCAFHAFKFFVANPHKPLDVEAGNKIEEIRISIFFSPF